MEKTMGLPRQKLKRVMEKNVGRLFRRKTKIRVEENVGLCRLKPKRIMEKPKRIMEKNVVRSKRGPKRVVETNGKRFQRIFLSTKMVIKFPITITRITLTNRRKSRRILTKIIRRKIGRAT
jgi:hypothetical protein